MVGFTNEGNSCYFNSALSCFIYTPYIANNYKLLNNEELSIEIKKIVQMLFVKNFDTNHTVCTKNVLNSFKKKHKLYNNHYQHDSHEIFMCLTEIIPPLLKHVFDGILCRSVICKKCKTKNEVNESFNTLILSDKGSFEQCFFEYFKTSQIDDYECTHCKMKTCANFSTKIIKCPKVVVLKTRAYNPPLNIIFGSLNFELYAVSQYSGNSMSGHYTSCVKSHYQWYSINDECCVKMNNPVQIRNSCILFYKQT